MEIGVSKMRGKIARRRRRIAWNRIAKREASLFYTHLEPQERKICCLYFLIAAAGDDMWLSEIR